MYSITATSPIHHSQHCLMNLSYHRRKLTQFNTFSPRSTNLISKPKHSKTMCTIMIIFGVFSSIMVSRWNMYNKCRLSLQLASLYKPLHSHPKQITVLYVEHELCQLNCSIICSEWINSCKFLIPIFLHNTHYFHCCCLCMAMDMGIHVYM